MLTMPFRLRLGITTKITFYFLVISITSLMLLGYIAITSVDKVGHFARESTAYLGNKAISASIYTLEMQTKELMLNKAREVAKEINLYLSSHPELRDDELSKDILLADIAVQPVCKTGYTCMYEETHLSNPDDTIVLFHVNPELVNASLFDCKSRKFYWVSLDLNYGTLSGYYRETNTTGTVHDKFFYVVPVDGEGYMVPMEETKYAVASGEKRYMVAAIIDKDELLTPSTRIRGDVDFMTQRTSEYIEQQKERINLLCTISILGIIIIASISAFLLLRTLTKPILALTEGSKIMAKGDFDYKVHINTHDEIAELADQFNIMSDSLKESYSNLERKVDERTKIEHRRSEQLRAINEVGRSISSLASIDTLLPHVANSFNKRFPFYNLGIFIAEGKSGNLIMKASPMGYKENARSLEKHLRTNDSIVHQVFSTGKPLLTNDQDEIQRYYSKQSIDNNVKSELVVPIKLGIQILGVLDIRSIESKAFDEIDLFTFQILADQIAIAIDNARLYQEAQDKAVLEERNRLAREIHDTLAQGFVGIVLQLEAAEQVLNEDLAAAQQHLYKARKLARKSLNEARQTVWSLHPGTNGQLNLVEASIRQELRDFCEDSKVKVDFQLFGRTCLLSAETQHALLRICRESLINVKKHAKADKVIISISFNERLVELKIKDNGIGFNPEVKKTSSFGIINMKERAEAQGGTLVVESQKGKGTLVQAKIPMNGRFRNGQN